MNYIPLLLLVWYTLFAHVFEFFVSDVVSIAMYRPVLPSFHYEICRRHNTCSLGPSTDTKSMPIAVFLVQHSQYPFLAEGTVLHAIEPIRCLLLLFHLLELLLVLLHVCLIGERKNGVYFVCT